MEKAKMTWPGACSAAEKFLPYLDAHWPQYVEEMKGTPSPSLIAHQSLNPSHDL
jgi:hypothetical protein